MVMKPGFVFRVEKGMLGNTFSCPLVISGTSNNSNIIKTLHFIVLDNGSR
jgi:hypothetical protein